MELNIMRFSKNNPIEYALILQAVGEVRKFVAEWKKDDGTSKIDIYADDTEKNLILDQLRELNPSTKKFSTNIWCITFAQNSEDIYKKLSSLNYTLKYI